MLTRDVRTQFFFCINLFNISSNLLFGGVDEGVCVTFCDGLFLNGIEKSWASLADEDGMVLGPELKSIQPVCVPPLKNK